MRLEGGQLTDIKPNAVSRPNIKSLLLLLAFVFLPIHNSWEQLQNKQIAGMKHCQPIQPNPPYPFQTFFTPPRHLIKNRYSAKCTFLQRCELNGFLQTVCRRPVDHVCSAVCSSHLITRLQFVQSWPSSLSAHHVCLSVCPPALSAHHVCPQDNDSL